MHGYVAFLFEISYIVKQGLLQHVFVNQLINFGPK
jgi:hypothetical protein